MVVNEPVFIAIDWGTTNRRAYAITADGAVIETVRDDRGVLAVPRDAFAREVAEIGLGWAICRCCAPAWSDRRADGLTCPIASAAPACARWLTGSSGLSRAALRSSPRALRECPRPWRRFAR
jgi:hypothetical protein